MKTYTFEVRIEEGCDEFWEELEGKTGCDEVKNLLVVALEDAGLYLGSTCFVELTEYKKVL